MAITNPIYVADPRLNGAPGVLTGNGAPAAEVFPAGTIYLRRDAVGVYITDGAGTWTQAIDDATLAAVTGAALVGYDNSTSGLVATDLQAAVDELDGAIDGLDASAVAYDNSTSGLTATDAQDAIDELDGTLDDLQSDATGAGLSMIGFEDAGALFTATDPEAALQELGASRAALNSGIGYALISATDATGGSTSSTVTVKLYDLEGNAIAKVADLQIAGISGTCTWGAAAKGSVLGAGTTSQIRTDANGEFEAILDNSADEALYPYTLSTPYCALANAIIISPSPAASPTWSA